jgi:hypothetical protein
MPHNRSSPLFMDLYCQCRLYNACKKRRYRTMSNRSSGANVVTIQKEINILSRKEKNLCENITSGAVLIPVCLQVSSVDSIFANLMKLNGQPQNSCKCLAFLFLTDINDGFYMYLKCRFTRQVAITKLVYLICRFIILITGSKLPPLVWVQIYSEILH